MSIQQFAAPTALTSGASEPDHSAPCRFLETVTLAKLIAPISEEEFRRSISTKTTDHLAE
jgi:hypothetical protein